MPEARKQFTFYRSFYDSISRIKSSKDRATAYDVLCAYALFGTEPDIDSLPDAVAVTFLLSKPNLDSSRKKAASGSNGGSAKRTGSKQEANPKQTGSEKENENEYEYEKEKEYECNSGGAGDESADARCATAEELAVIGLNPGEFFGVTLYTAKRVFAATNALFKACGLAAPTPIDRRNVFVRTAWRATEAGNDIEPDSYNLLKYAFGQAHDAGKPGNWKYINGIMDRCSARGITTVEQAKAWDCERPDRYVEGET